MWGIIIFAVVILKNGEVSISHRGNSMRLYMYSHIIKTQNFLSGMDYFLVDDSIVFSFGNTAGDPF